MCAEQFKQVLGIYGNVTWSNCRNSSVSKSLSYPVGFPENHSQSWNAHWFSRLQYNSKLTLWGLDRSCWHWKHEAIPAQKGTGLSFLRTQSWVSLVLEHLLSFILLEKDSYLYNDCHNRALLESRIPCDSCSGFLFLFLDSGHIPQLIQSQVALWVNVNFQ